mgnify:CR=1 FL=1
MKSAKRGIKGWLIGLSLIMLLNISAAAQEPGGLADPPDPDELQTNLPIDIVQVTGNRLVSNSEIEEITKRYQGRRLSFAEMETLTKEIEQLYRSHGYFLVNAILPTQESVRGVLQVHVLEGKIQNVAVEGNQRYPTEFLRERFLHAVPAEGAKTTDFQRALFLLNELPDVQVKAVLSAGSEEGGTSVILKAEEDKNFHLTLGYNNFGARLTGEHRFGLGTDLSSIFTPGDQFLVRSLLSTPADNTLFVQGAYSVPVSHSGTRLGIQYANGAYTAGQEVAILDIRGTANIFALTAAQPLARSLTHSSDLDFRLSYNDLDNRILNQRLSKDEYTSATLGYSGQWRDSNGRFLGRASVTKGLGGTRRGDPFASRMGAGGDFTRFNLDIARVQEFNSQWLAVARASMQFSGDPLFSAEQFALGGPDTVRGFSQAEALGDQAYNTTLELRWSPIADNTDLFQTVFFLDHGGVTRNRPQPGEKGSEQLTGAGLGFRFNIEQTRIRLDLGFPLSPSSNSRGISPVLYGQIQTRF